MHLHGRRTGVVAQLPDGMVVLSVKPGQLANTARALRVRPHPAWGVPRAGGSGAALYRARRLLAIGSVC